MRRKKAKVVPPGDSAVLDTDTIWGYSTGDDLQFYFYEVIEDMAYFSGGLAVPHTQLAKQQFHVIIDDKELTKSDVQ